MENINTYEVYIDGKDYTKHVVFPIKWSNLLDERLDETRLTLKNLSENIIHPLTPLTIKLTDKNEKEIILNTVVTTDEAEEMPVGSGKYDHEIMCLEETKILEGIVVDALTFTNSLGRDYTKNAAKVSPTFKGDGSYQSKDFLDIPDTYMSPLGEGNRFTFCSIKSLMGDADKAVTKNSSMKVYDNNNNNIFTTKNLSETYTIPSLLLGTYRVDYKIELVDDPIYSTITASFTFYVVDNKPPLPKWNIATVIDRALDVAETHLQGVSPRFKLNMQQHAQFTNIEAPEFAFTNATLKEILDQIGGYIHGIPRLRGNEIYFDMLGGTEQAKIANYPYISNVYSQDIESYCTSLDSSVDNMVCLTDRDQGSVVDPDAGSGKSLRTETLYARVVDSNAFISTRYPIQEIISVVCTRIPGKDNIGFVDITPYVFEAAEYARMSSYTCVNPTSRVYGIYYTQGEKNIQGLNFKQQTVNSEFGDYAIIRILEEASGKDIGELGKNFPALSFRISYIPVFSARTQQTKQYIGEYKQPRALVFNQGANIIETRYYGENMKGAVARMGNVDRTVMYNLSDFHLIPEVGLLFGDDYYISGVTCEMYPEFIKCMLSLSQDFNRLSQYIGINSLRRFYEVSEKQAYRRDIKYADYLVIGDSVTQDETLVNAELLTGCFGFYTTRPPINSTRGKNPTTVIAQGYSEDGDPIGARISLPLVTAAFGTAMVATFSYEDNYSAGNMVQKQSEGSVSGYFTNAVAYGDYYGRVHALDFSFRRTTSFTGDDLRLPETRSAQSDTYVHTSGNKLVIDKDGREIISINYILEAVTNRKNVIIGSALARNFGLVKSINITAENAPTLYILKTRIGKFDDKIDVAAATAVWNFMADESGNTHATLTGKSLKFDDFTPDTDGVAWAIANPQGELYFGANEPITAGQMVTMPYITIRHNIFNL